MLTTLKNGIMNFLLSRHWAEHFRRIPMLDQLAKAPADLRVPAALGDRLRGAALAAEAELLQGLNSAADGLDAAQVDAARAEAGWNTIAQDRPMSAGEHLWLCFRTPFNILLTLLAIVSWVTDDFKGTVVIGSMVLFSTVLRFWQEGRANKAAASLQAMVSNTATVLRRASGGLAPAALHADGQSMIWMEGETRHMRSSGDFSSILFPAFLLLF